MARQPRTPGRRHRDCPGFHNLFHLEDWRRLAKRGGGKSWNNRDPSAPARNPTAASAGVLQATPSQFACPHKTKIPAPWVESSTLHVAGSESMTR